MRICGSLEQAGIKGGTVAIGVFDGVHLGHRAIISRAAKLAEELGRDALAVTFSEHPLSVLDPARAPLRLTSPEIRREEIARLGVSALIELCFTEELSRVAPGDFLAELSEKLAPSVVVVGENFSFGAKGLGTPERLLRDGPRYGFRAEVVPLLHALGGAVSSTRIRDFLATGDISRANELLGRPFEIAGKVAHGDERGRTLGFPTANILPPPGYALPRNGAYAALASWDGHSQRGMASVGNNPTFGGVSRRIEIHLFDFAGDIYGRELRVAFMSRLRDERRFSSADALRSQLEKDEKAARDYFAR